MRTCLLVLLLLGNVVAQAADDVAAITLRSPVPHQVVQREWFVPQKAATEQPIGNRGFASVLIHSDKPAEGIYEYRFVGLNAGDVRETTWASLDVKAGSAVVEGSPKVTSGGWYRLEVRCRSGEKIVARGAVEPVGVGEVFLVAGQSYATNSNDEQLKVTEPSARVVAFDVAKGTWAVAHDPQPTPDGSKGGSIWPPLGDALSKELRVPIAFVNVAWGGTSSHQWMPNGQLHQRLIQAGKTIGRFRAVLWQQGESDVIAKTPTETYVENLRTIRETAVKAWGFEPPWLLAKSTLHPTVYNDAAGEGRIRAAINQLSSMRGFRPGPDTDQLAGENRGGPKSMRHFSAVGQRNAAQMWLAVLQRELSAPSRGLVMASLPELHLLEPVWSSPVVHRESSVLLQKDGNSPVTARLAFPAEEIIEISTANREHRYAIGADVVLSADKQVLTFAKPQPVQPLAESDLYPPKDAPNSYRHRARNPEQNLMYRPGSWFHEHNVEITYRRASAPQQTSMVTNLLPKTLARLKAGEPLTLGISGDSISTGLDASGLFQTAPYQPGYPDLVAAQLQATFKSEIALHNRAVSGWSIANGLSDLDKLLAYKPQLIIVAYGMNDVGRRDPKWFSDRTREFVQRVKAADPEIELILVSPMLGNSEWVHTPREMFAKYRDELQALTGPGVALADVTQVWDLLLKHKHDLDITGNGLNHPNDFGHRLYAQTVLSLLVSGK